MPGRGEEVGAVDEERAVGSLILLLSGSQALEVRTSGLDFEIKIEKMA